MWERRELLGPRQPPPLTMTSVSDRVLALYDATGEWHEQLAEKAVVL